MYYSFGKTFSLLTNFEAKEVELAGMDDDIFIQGQPLETTHHSHPKVAAPMVRQDDQEFNLINFDPTFGLSETYPGLLYLISINGPFQMLQGFIEGSQVTEHSSVAICDNLVSKQLVDNVLLANNVTGSMLQSEGAEFFYKGFDAALILTNIAQQLHPIVFNCWNGGEWIVEHFRH